MKKQLFGTLSLTAVAVASSLMFSGCKGDEDTTPPVITLVGSEHVDVVLNDTYTDEGATAEDDEDGDLTASITTDNPVDPDVAATYTVTYSVSDAAGNPASESRTVVVYNESEDLEGTYDASEGCSSSGSNTYTVEISASSTVNNKILISNAWDYFTNTVAATVSGTTITIAAQTPDSNEFQIEGTGTVSGTTITIDYVVTDLSTSDTDACTVTYTLQ